MFLLHLRGTVPTPTVSTSPDLRAWYCRIVKLGLGMTVFPLLVGSSNIKMKNIICGPGHGISIGSLGKDNSTDTVIGVVLDTATLTGTTNGLRIKTWQGGSGAVRSVRYENVVMNNVSNPIIIDQFYCDSSNPCKNLTSAVKISQVMYRNIQGTSKTSQAIKFACSDTVPCSNIVLNNVNLLLQDGTAATTTSCNCAVGFDYGFVQPSVECLRSTTTNSQCQQQVSQNGDDHTMEDNERAYFCPHRAMMMPLCVKPATYFSRFDTR
ncbi:putative polygalacturonase [Acorus calamus]|uniref:Polygalacturonase n=1 Tax=Acorus calamus TaxID=4465 RepID=A0AAV9DP52_ACOCL|nr:putative polygalacturonase [Acorus calamus]